MDRIGDTVRRELGRFGTAGEMTDVVKLTIYVLDTADYKKHLREIGSVYREYFGKHFPAMTLVGARDLFDAADGCLIEIEGVAALA